ncbi:hypothetical protein RND81_02G226400 [Saponaria officinalis]|uniref:Squalene monooxygenase n=1 Tax=Saponaria officinalis TaxID=3572 RepID=A0AAW1MWI1_SAPOF
MSTVLRSRNTLSFTVKMTTTSYSVLGGCSAASDGAVTQTDVIIVGAGVAGAALSYSLAKDGRHVRVIERELSELDRISGELLHPGGYLKLIELGLEDCVENVDAQKMVGYQCFKDGKKLTWTYPFQKFGSNVAARCFYNGRFVQRLREKAASLPNLKLEQGTVTSLTEEHGIMKGVNYKMKNGKESKAYAPLTVVCGGFASNLRRFFRSPKVMFLLCQNVLSRNKILSGWLE